MLSLHKDTVASAAEGDIHSRVGNESWTAGLGLGQKRIVMASILLKGIPKVPIKIAINTLNKTITVK